MLDVIREQVVPFAGATQRDLITSFSSYSVKGVTQDSVFRDSSSLKKVSRALGISPLECTTTAVGLTWAAPRYNYKSLIKIIEVSV
jgi:hypothetical protein